jgi:hypothetical protein
VNPTGSPIRTRAGRVFHSEGPSKSRCVLLPEQTHVLSDREHQTWPASAASRISNDFKDNGTKTLQSLDHLIAQLGDSSSAPLYVPVESALELLPWLTPCLSLKSTGKTSVGLISPLSNTCRELVSIWNTRARYFF